MTEKIYGYKDFTDKIDITDPCYNRDVWCRINGFPITPGEYECYIVTKKTRYGNRVARIGIRMEKADSFTMIGSIGVDAGMAGFFNDKPDYTDAEWDKFCHMVEGNESAWLLDEGFCSNSGYGDGGYNVYAGYKDGKFTEAYIDFI